MSASSAAIVELARVLRGDKIECRHFGAIAVCNADGELLYAAGDANLHTYLRSAGKPVQLLAALECNIAEAYQLDEAELALACASHNGEARHVETARRMLAKAGLDPADLRCGPHRPIGVDLGTVEDTANWTPLHNNCSGKHAAMLMACKQRGWPLETYLDPEHPHQKNILAAIAEHAGAAPAEIGIGVDGCSAPVFYLTLRQIATMYARLAASQTKKHPFNFMTAHPEMIAGDNRFDTAVMQAGGGKLIAKVGAEGLECFGLRTTNALGIAIKIIDGNNRGTSPVGLRLLQRYSALPNPLPDALQHYAQRVVRNCVQREVGSVVCAPDFD